MRAVLTNFGTIGDFAPLLTLGRELARRGHTPLMAFPPFARAMATQNPFQFLPLGPDLSSLRDQINMTWTEAPGLYSSSQEMLTLLFPFRDAFDQIFTELREACRSADVLIGGAAQPIARMVHEVTGIPFVSIQVAHFGGSGGPALREAGDMLINPFRRKIGLPPVEDPLVAGANSPQMTIYAMSKHLRGRPVDWPSHYHLTGFFFEKNDALFQPDSELEKFIAQDSAPVVMTLGSIAHRKPQALAKLLEEAACFAGYRAVIQGIPVESASLSSSPAIYRCGFIPHAWLFSRAACIVLHGGAGTAASTFRAGVPGIFVPHGDCYDQPYWAQLAVEAGCAEPAIPYSDLTAETLASTIRATMSNDNLRVAAASLAAKIRKEPGVALAADLITEFVARVGLCQDC